MPNSAESMRRRVTRLAASAAMALVMACGVSEPSADELLIAVSVAPHAWLVAEIVGDAASVVTALPPTADPHSHTPTDAEVTRLSRCRILFRAGVPFENGTWLRALASHGARVVDLRLDVELLDDDHGHADTGHESDADSGHGSDPHTWTSPRRLAVQAETIAAELAQLLPQHTEAIRRRTRDTVAKLTALDTELKRRLAPHRGRAFFVHHPSWSYFAADYGLHQVALEAGGSDPTDAELTAWLRRARNDGAGAVFVQPQTASKAARAVARPLGVPVQTLDPLAYDVVAQLSTTAERLDASWQAVPAPSGATVPTRRPAEVPFQHAVLVPHPLFCRAAAAGLPGRGPACRGLDARGSRGDGRDHREPARRGDPTRGRSPAGDPRSGRT